MYQNPKHKSEESILKGIRNLSEEQYCRYIYDMHRALKFDTLLKAKFRPQDLSLKMQKLWSDRLPASTVKAYAQICHVINNRKFFDHKTYEILSKVLETIMENPANKYWLSHAGMKGGSTAWVLTKAMYATTTAGDRFELAYFFNDLTPAEQIKIQGWMNSFEPVSYTHLDVYKRQALYLVKNDTVQGRLNEDKLMPLASTMKILVALEFAKQASQAILDPAQNVALSELDKYCLLYTSRCV